MIGHYLDQLEQIAATLGAPLLCGRMPRRERESLCQAFRAGSVRLLCVSKVADFALDLPSASVAIEISGTFGSRQEEAQRLGRLLRPKSGDNRAGSTPSSRTRPASRTTPATASASSPSRAIDTPSRPPASSTRSVDAHGDA